jgi:micrococcal nuclease
MKIIKDFLPLGAIAIMAAIFWMKHSTPPVAQTPSQNPTQTSTANLPEWRVVPGSIHDGDTIRVTNNAEELKIRFCGIDAPELSQPGGIEARDYLKKLLDDGGGKVKLDIVDTDRYGRKVAEVWANGSNGEQLLNAVMVVNGMAYHYQQYSGSCSNRSSLISTEKYARDTRLGVWSTEGAIPPWEWRRKKK